MATFAGNPWTRCKELVTTAGVWASVYLPGDQGETVKIRFPDGRMGTVKTPGLADWFLVAEDGEVTVYYTKIVQGGHDLVRIATTIPCGVAVGALTSGGTGPIGPAGAPGPKGDKGDTGAQGEKGEDAVALTQQEIDAIAERVFSLPPAPDHFGLPEYVRYGTRFQETIAVMVNQALMQYLIRNGDEAAANMIRDGYTPQTGV
jgi:hypothetical protein